MKEREEAALQFEEIWNKHHDPDERVRKRMLQNKLKRQEAARLDKGL